MKRYGWWKVRSAVCEATGSSVKYAWIERHQRQWPVTLQCEVLGVSASGYFERQVRSQTGRPQGRQRVSDEALLAYIKSAHAAGKGEYGWPRVWKELLAQGVRVGKERVQKLIRLHGIKARGKRRFVVTTTDSTHELPDYCQSPPTCRRVTSVRPGRMQSGQEISRTSRQRRADCIWWR